MRQKIQQFLSGFDLDVRVTHNARFIDQKVTPDVLSFIAECVVNHVAGNLTVEFSVKDIWESRYFITNSQWLFSKPSPANATATHEYDKFIAQPLKTLGYAHVLNETQRNGRNYYSVANADILQYIATDPRSAYNFLYEYLTKVLQDSGFYVHIESYERLFHGHRLTGADFLDLKTRFERFIIGNTPIKKHYEPNRMFPKVLNIIATEKIMPGSVDGRISQHIFYYNDLMYNRPNWRDKNKNKTITRQEAARLCGMATYNPWRVGRAKAFIDSKYTLSELHDQWGAGPADQIHHIFPASAYPMLSEYLENLIKLTATQHLSKAHPGNNTRIVDVQYQKQCLLAKSFSIEESLRLGETCYRKEFFIYVVNTGYNLKLDFALSLHDVRRDIQALP